MTIEGIDTEVVREQPDGTWLFIISIPLGQPLTHDPSTMTCDGELPSNGVAKEKLDYDTRPFARLKATGN